MSNFWGAYQYAVLTTTQGKRIKIQANYECLQAREY